MEEIVELLCSETNSCLGCASEQGLRYEWNSLRKVVTGKRASTPARALRARSPGSLWMNYAPDDNSRHGSARSAGARPTTFSAFHDPARMEVPYMMRRMSAKQSEDPSNSSHYNGVLLATCALSALWLAQLLAHEP